MLDAREAVLNYKKLISDLLTAFGVQGVSFICSVVTTLLVPKILGVEEFAYWQLFVFYTSYVSFFQLGLNDGIYLQHGGESRDAIDKSLIRSEFNVGASYQLVAALIIAGYGLFCESGDRVFVILASSSYLLLSNLSFYISFVFQAMNETKIASYSTIVNRGIYLILLLLCIGLRIEDFEVYVFFYLVAQAITLSYLLWKARDFARVGLLGFRQSARETLRSMKLGVVLTIANVSAQLIMGMSRIVIDHVWGLAAFGQVSLSLSIVNFALVFVSQAAMVLFPAMRSVGREKMRIHYIRLRDCLGAILPVAMLLYAPLRILVGLWLPQYEDALTYLAFLFPVCLFEIQTNLTVVTFIKVRCEPRVLLVINVLAVLCTLAAQVMAILVFDTPVASVLASLFGVSMRYAIGTIYLGSVYENRNPKMMACMFAESIAFMAITTFVSIFWGFIFCVGMLAVHFALCRSELNALLGELRRVSFQ